MVWIALLDMDLGIESIYTRMIYITFSFEQKQISFK